MAEIHIVGTAHVSQKSVNEVLETVDLREEKEEVAPSQLSSSFSSLKSRVRFCFNAFMW